MKEKTILTIPLKTVSPNVTNTQHWRIRRKLSKIQKASVYYALLAAYPKPTVPCQVTITRIASRAMDQDNLGGALKTVIDTIADFLIPNLPPGKADGDPRISWVYNQEKGSREQEIRIEIESTI